MPEVWWSLANMHDGLIPKHLRVGGQQEEEETARHFNKSPLPSKHLPVFSIPAFKLPIPLPLHSLHPHPFPPIFSPYPHPTRTFPHKVLVLRSACRSNVSDDTDASSTPTWCNKPDDVLCQQLSTRSTHAKGKRGKGRGKREEEELKNMYVKVYSSSVWLDMPTVSFLRGPQKSLQNSGLCEGFCKIDKVVL